jgi:folate-binding Fe-S cluster repair protein YgfZ
MLNYESVGGVSFKKGCYPGQEVVARSQFRGTLKRRAFLVHAETPMAPGEAIYAAGEPDQPAGLVAQSANAPQGGHDAIVCLQLSALQAPSLHVGNTAGAALQILSLPYALLDDI